MANPSGMAMLRSMVATSALYNGKRDKKDDYTDVCHPGTREKHLNDLATWADNGPADERLQWASAIAGAGKTAMMRTFCHLLEKKVGAFASFFIWQGDPKRNTLTHFPATVAYQLSRRITALVPRIERAFVEDPLVLETSFENQMEQLIVKPLLDVKVEHHLIIVVDGLDELDATSQTEFLSFIPHFLSQLSTLPISVLVSSRPEAEIIAAFKHPRLASITRATQLGASDEDIWKFLNDKFDDINLRYPDLQIECGGQWPSHVKRTIMVMQSSGLFIWPTVAINYIDRVALGLGHNKRLEQVLSSAEPKPWVASPLDNLYRAILQAHAPEDPESVEFLCFKQRLAYLCLPIRFSTFVRKFSGWVADFSHTPVGVVFDATLDELWGSVAGLSSLFSPRAPPSPSEGKSPTPAISHLSLRDFTFNRARCGDKFYYSSEQELHTEVVCKFLKFFNTRQAYQDCAEMSAQFILRAGEFLESHLREAAVSEELGRCMDDVMLDAIPPAWPLVTQMYLIVKLFDGLYKLAESPEFPDGSQRREAFLSKLVVFFRIRAANAEEWDAALFRLAFPTAKFASAIFSIHSVHCWHVGRSAQCACIDAYIRNISLSSYQHALPRFTLFQHAESRLLPDGQGDVAQDSHNVLQYIISLSETSPRATRLSSFIHVRSDYWIQILLKHCPPNDDLYNTLVPICTAPLPDLPKREEDKSWVLAKQFLEQTDGFNAYTERCQEAGIETKFLPTKIPDDWWKDEDTRNTLLARWYSPPFDIPNDWWEDDRTRNTLLRRGDKPLFDIPDDWWEDLRTRPILLTQGYIPPTPASSRAVSPMTLSENDSEDASSHLSLSLPQLLPLSSSKAHSITPSSDIALDTPGSDVDDVLRAPLPIDLPHVEPTPAPATVPAKEAIVLGTSGTSTTDVEDTGMTLPTDIPSQPVAYTIPVPDSVSGINGAQPLGQRRRARVRTFFDKLIRRP